MLWKFVAGFEYILIRDFLSLIIIMTDFDLKRINIYWSISIKKNYKVDYISFKTIFNMSQIEQYFNNDKNIKVFAWVI